MTELMDQVHPLFNDLCQYKFDTWAVALTVLQIQALKAEICDHLAGCEACRWLLDQLPTHDKWRLLEGVERKGVLLKLVTEWSERKGHHWTHAGRLAYRRF